MPFITALTRDRSIYAAVRGTASERFSVAGTRSWNRLLRLVRERPVTGVVIDSAALPPAHDVDALMGLLRGRFPSLGLALIAHDLDARTLVRLGRTRTSGLILAEVDGLALELPRITRRLTLGTTTSIVMRRVGMQLPPREARVVQVAMEGAIAGWGADDLAERSGWTRAHLGVRLTAHGLPSPGHLLLWAKLLHAGRWLPESGRSAESVSRQLEYSSGAAFRRALHNYVGATPSEVVKQGGFDYVFRHFLDECGLDDSLREHRSVA